MRYKIYKIMSFMTGAILYVGCSNNCHVRHKQHISTLSKGSHFNKGLQSHVNFFGVDDLVFSEVQSIREKYYYYGVVAEKKWIKKLKPAFNINGYK